MFPRHRHIVAITAAATVFSLLVAPTTALGDVVSPPPSSCPGGTVPVTDHGGPRCEPEAPRNCPPGWRGVIGGKCILFECSDDTSCAAEGKRCTPTELCVEQRPMYWEYHQRGETSKPAGKATTATARRTATGNLLAEPPPAPDPDHPVDVATDVCTGGRACKEPAECKSGKKLCLAPGAVAARRPANADVANSATPVEKQRGGGCAGCTTVSMTSSSSLARREAAGALFLVVGVAMAVGWVAKRRRRSHDR